MLVCLHVILSHLELSWAQKCEKNGKLQYRSKHTRKVAISLAKLHCKLQTLSKYLLEDCKSIHRSLNQQQQFAIQLANEMTRKSAKGCNILKCLLHFHTLSRNSRYFSLFLVRFLFSFSSDFKAWPIHYNEDGIASVGYEQLAQTRS